MKNSLPLPSLANRNFNNLKDEINKPIYTYNDEFMRHFVGQSIKGGRCSALNQYQKSNISDQVFNIISKELDINGNVCEILEKYFEFSNKQRKIIENEQDSQFSDNETMMKKKEPNILAKNLKNYQYTKKYQN